jgi:hypothetical protein
MTPELLVDQITNVIPGRLSAAVLYGSVAAGDFVPEKSDYNVLLVIDALGTAELDALAQPIAGWVKAGHRPPLLFTDGQLPASADTFPIELFDMRQSRRVLFGQDPLQEVTIKPEHLRLQLERELTEKLLTLREGYLVASGKPKQVLQLLSASVTGVLVLLRAALRLFQEETPAVKTEAVRLLAKHIAFDVQPILDVDDLKRGRRSAADVEPAKLFGSYLKTIEQVAEAIDRHPQT